MNNDEFTFQDLKEALLRKGKFGLAVLLALLIGSIIYVTLKKPIFESEIRIRLSGASSVTEFVLAGATTPWNDVPTQLELIKSKSILKRVVNELNLQFQPLNKKFNQIVKIQYLKIHDSMPKGTYILELKSDGFRIKSKEGNINIEGTYGVLTESKYLDILILPLPKKIKDKVFKFQIRDENAAVRSLSKNIKVNQEGKSFIAVIKARAGDPVLAKRIAEEVANGYYEFTLEDVRFQASSLRLFLEEQVKKVESELSEYETELAKVKDKLGTYNFFALENFSESMKDIFSKMNDLEFEKVKTSIERDKAQNEILTLKQQMEGRGYFKEYSQIASNLETSGDPKFVALLNRLYDLELKKASLSLKYSEENPEIMALESQIDEIKKSLIKTQEAGALQTVSTSDPVFQQLAQKLIANQVNEFTLSTRLTAIDSALKTYENKISTLPTNALIYSKIRRKIQALSGIYNLLLERLEQTKIEEASKISDVRIADYAMVPTSPISPKRIQTIFISIILGVIIGLFVSLTLYYLDDTVKFAYEVETITGKPCIGKIPIFFNAKKASEDPLVVDKNPLSPESEAFKKLRFNIEILNNRNPKIIAVTSVLENEGKSTVVANLALAYTLAGFKTLVIDGDLRKPMLHKIFKIQNQIGFTDLITKNILKPQASEFSNLFVLPTGGNSLNVLKVLDAFDLRRIRELLLETFDVVILDTPPLLPVAEVNTLANFAGNLILVARADYTSKRLLHEISTSLPETTNFLGTVINFYQRSEGYYRYYKYQHEPEENGKFNVILRKLGIK